MKNLPLNPDVEMFKWGPALIRTFYSADFLEGIFGSRHFRVAFPDEEWPKGLALYKDHYMTFVNELWEIEKCGKSIFMKYMLPLEARKQIFEKWQKDLKKLEEKEAEIEKIDLHAEEESNLKNLWHDFHEATISFWTHVTIPELANYGSLPFLEEELKKYILGEEIGNAMEVFTAPENPSFYQTEEMELSETDDVESHAKKYFWIRNSYKEVLIADKDFFIERKKELPPNVRSDFKAHRKEIQRRKTEVKEKYRLPEEIMKIAEAIVNGIEWQDDRKKHIWIYLHYKSLLISEVARRYGYEKDDLLNFREMEIENMLQGKLDLKEQIGHRRNHPYGFFCANSEVAALPINEGEMYWNAYVVGKIDKKVKEIKGVVASKGKNPKVSGKVRIVSDPSKADNFQIGDILVTSMTTPEFVFLMKRSGAIVTDIGGLTSHVAIVARELQKPCVIGTKIATQVLKDGDMVEVDAEKGIVRVIKS